MNVQMNVVSAHLAPRELDFMTDLVIKGGHLCIAGLVPGGSDVQARRARVIRRSPTAVVTDKTRYKPQRVRQWCVAGIHLT